LFSRGPFGQHFRTEMEVYRAPYRNRKRRLPTLVWPRELPIEGEPADVVAARRGKREVAYREHKPAEAHSGGQFVSRAVAW